MAGGVRFVEAALYGNEAWRLLSILSFLGPAYLAMGQAFCAQVENLCHQGFADV